MKQSAFVIATLLATAQAGSNQLDAKARFERNVRQWLNQGLKFDTKVIEAAHKHTVNEAKAQNKLNKELREDFEKLMDVGDEYVKAVEYERSQEVYTPPSSQNGNWGNVHYNNPQKIFDNYKEVAEDFQEVKEDYAKDFQKFAEEKQENNEELQNKIRKAWNKHGERSSQAFENAVRNGSQAWQEAKVNAPQNLAAVDSTAIREDMRNFVQNVGSAAEAVRQTIRGNAEQQHKVDEQIDRTNYRYTKERLQIAKGYNKAIEYELKNTHLDRGLPGGEGRLWFSNKQEIVDKWAKPVEAQQKATAQWRADIEREMAEKQRINAAWKAEAQKSWPPKFQAVENSWNELAANFDQPQPQQLGAIANEAEVNANLRNVLEKGYQVDKAVIDDVLNYENSIKTQNNQLKEDIQQYIAEKQAINQQYVEAYNYETENIHFNQAPNGDWSVVVDNKEIILDKWNKAMMDDIEAREQLKQEFIEYQRSIAAEKAAFRRTAKAQWPQRFQAFGQAVQKFDASLHGPEDRAAMQEHINANAPQAMAAVEITDAQQRDAELIRQHVYDNINDRLEFKWTVRRDIRDYMQNTADARNQLRNEAKEWKQASKRVQDMYAAAWNYQVANTKFTRGNAQHPPSIELENPQQVSDNFRAAGQADIDLGQNIKEDIIRYQQQIQPAKAELAKEINTKWVPQVEAINRSDNEIFEEVVNFPKFHANSTMDAINEIHQGMQEAANNQTLRAPNVTHPFANQMSLIHMNKQPNMSTNEQLAYGSVFLAMMVGVAAISNKNQKKNSHIEFDVEDLEMTNKRESKKQIKKTLKDIMKKSNTKVGLMNN